MPKNKTRRVVLDEYKRAKAAEGTIEIEVADGRVFTIPPPQLWPDEVALAGSSGKASDQVAAARALIGDEDYEAFIAAGGSSAIVWGIVADELGADVPESSGSSSS